jgi:oxygen-independent coproporphyrinogen-3 oxidase
MTRFETDWSAADSYTPFLEAVADRLGEPLRDGLVLLEGQSLRVTEAGRPFLRNICMAFDARIERGGEAARQFSRTV